MFRKQIAILLILALCLGCAACTSQDAPNGTEAPTQGATIPPEPLPEAPPVQTVSADEVFSDRDRDASYDNATTVTLSDKGSKVNGSGVTVKGSTITITAEGTYVFTGVLSNGQIRVNVSKQQKVHIVLQDAMVNCKGSAALYVIQGDKLFVTLAEGTENVLSSTGTFTTLSADGVDGAVFTKADTTFNGSGELMVISEKGHGIVCKDDLKFTGGSYAVDSAKQGLSGKDSLCIEKGSFTIKSGTDALRSKHDTDNTKGYVYIYGGDFNITAGNDGVDASKDLQITGGSMKIVTGAGSSNQTATEDSFKGLKAVGIVITGGSFQIDAEDDAIHSNDALTVSGGTFVLATGDDALHADTSITVCGGEVDIAKSYEGMEGRYITLYSGEIMLMSSDDGINAGGGNDDSAAGGPFGGFDKAEDAFVAVYGGKLSINAGGDGVDSNGDFIVSGGTVYLDGPTNPGNGPLDYAGKAKITGGTFVALGSAGMAMNFGEESTQGAILCALNGTAPDGTEVSVKDSTGKVLASYVSQKTFQSILISAPGMAQGQTYTVCAGDATAEFTLETLIYGSGHGGPGGPGGGPGGPGGGPGRP